MPTKREIEAAWAILEDPGEEPEIARMRAVCLVGRAISRQGDQVFRRLQSTLPVLSAAARACGERFLLEARRDAARWNTVAQVPEAEDLWVPAAAEPLPKLLRSERAEQRRAAAEESVDREDFTLGPALATRLAVEAVPEVKAALARALGVLGGEAGLPVLKRTSRDPSPEVRRASLEGLCHQPAEEAARLVLERTCDPIREVRHLAREFLVSYDPDLVLDLLERIPDGKGSGILRGGALAIQPWLGDVRADQVLHRLTSSSRPEVAITARRVAAKQETRSAAPPRPKPYLSLP